MNHAGVRKRQKHQQLYMSKEQQQFKVSDISARQKDESRRRAEVQKQPSKSKMPFNHFNHPTHYQYPVPDENAKNPMKNRVQKKLRAKTKEEDFVEREISSQTRF